MASSASSTEAAAAVTATTWETGTDTRPTMTGAIDCGEAKLEIPIVTPNVMLVLDNSGSMVAVPGGFWDHDANNATPTITRWESLWAVVNLIATGFNDSMNMGLVLFPSKAAKPQYSNLACVVNLVPEVQIAAMNAMKIITEIPPANADNTVIKGGTPATAAITTAIKELKAITDGRPQYMILVTDGAANCSATAADNTGLFESYDTNLPTTVGQAFADGIATYVVGIAIKNEFSLGAKDGNPDNTNTYVKLNEVAVAGGVPRLGVEKFYNTANQIELQAALDSISQQILSCTITLDPAPKYPDDVEIIVNGIVYGKAQVADCTTDSGWTFSDPKQDTVNLCGQACTDFQMTGLLNTIFRCPDST